MAGAVTWALGLPSREGASKGWGLNKDKMRTLIVGLGNPLLTDDAVGILIARRLAACLGDRANITVEEASVGGLQLAEMLIGYERAILIDAICRPSGVPGTVHCLSPGDFRGSPRAAGLHDMSFVEALNLLRRLGAALPKEIIILAVEAADVTTFGEGCTEAVAQAIPQAVAAALSIVDRTAESATIAEPLP